MLKHKDKSISAYKGDYRPVSIFENNKKIHGFNTTGLEGEEKLFQNTYNDALRVYGKSEYKSSVNLCPAPKSFEGYYEEGGTSYTYKLTAKEDGYFDFTGAMVTGEMITKTTLKAGTYTVSGCEYIQLWWEENGDFFSIPGTFTLDKDTELQAYFWYTSYDDIFLEDQYLQIEKGQVATGYSPFAGNPDFPASPDNFKSIVSASGAIRVEGVNLLPPDFGNFGDWQLKTPNIPKDGFVYNLDLIPGEYLLSFDVTTVLTSDSYGYVQFQESTDGGKVYKTTTHLVQFRKLLKKYTFTIKENIKYRIWAWQSMPERAYLFENWALQRTDIPEGKYPYFPTYKFTCSELAGIRVGEGDLYNYAEELNGEKHYYLSDLLSGKTLEKNIEKITFTGDEVFLQKAIESKILNCYYCDLSHIIKQNRIADNFLCNCFERLVTSQAEETGALLGQNDTNLYFFVDKTKFSTPDAFLNWLKSASESGNPVIIYYVTDAPQAEATSTDTPLQTYPMYTRIIVEASGDIRPGLLQCIKTQNNSTD